MTHGQQSASDAFLEVSSRLQKEDLVQLEESSRTRRGDVTRERDVRSRADVILIRDRVNRVTNVET